MSESYRRQQKPHSSNCADDVLAYVLYKINFPTEDYWGGINYLARMYPQIPDVRIAILGAYLSSTWLSSRQNLFLNPLNSHLAHVDKHTQAIIHYLNAYDIYMKYDKPYPSCYQDELERSVALSNRFVMNRIRLSEITDSSRKKKLIAEAVNSVERIWSEADLINCGCDFEIDYDDYISEYILGVNISEYDYQALLM